jgi:hypothetical protein
MNSIVINQLRPRSRENSIERMKASYNGSGKLHVSNLNLTLTE